MALRELCSYIPTPTRYRIAIGVATVAKIAMDFSCPCSKVLSPVWICYEKYMYSYWLFPTSVGQILYRQAEIWVWITRNKVLSWRSRGSPFSQCVPFFTRKTETVSIFMGIPKYLWHWYPLTYTKQLNHQCTTHAEQLQSFLEYGLGLLPWICL